MGHRLYIASPVIGSRGSFLRRGGPGDNPYASECGRTSIHECHELMEFGRSEVPI